MNRRKIWFTAACALLLAITLAGFVGRGIRAAPDSPAAAFSLPWWTVDGGGGSSQGGVYTLRGSAGQADASAASSGGVYSLRGGFWAGEWPYRTYIPRLSR